MKILRRNQTTVPLGLGVLRLVGSDMTPIRIVSPYFQTIDTRKKAPARNEQFILEIMAKKILVTSISQIASSTDYGSTQMAIYETSTGNIEVFRDSIVHFGGLVDHASFRAAIESAVITDAGFEGYTLTASDIVWLGIDTEPIRSFANPSRSLNSAFQISTTRDADVSYTVDVATTLSLTGGQTGTITLQYADDSGMSTNVKTVQTSVNGNTGTLTIGLALTQTVGLTLKGIIPAGKYVRLVTANTAGTPTFTMRTAQEVLI